MRAKKIKEIKGLLRSDPGKSPWIIWYSLGYSIVNYRNRESDYLKVDEVKQLIELYPDVEVIDIGRPLDEQDITI